MGHRILKSVIILVTFVALLNWGTPFLVNDVGTPGLIILPFAWFAYASIVLKACGVSMWKKEKELKNEKSDA